MTSIFVSYSRDDESIAARLMDRLRQTGVEVLGDDKALVAGMDWRDAILSSIRDADAIVVLLSRNTKRSGFVEKELRDSLHRDKLIVPILLDDEATDNWVWPLVADRQALELYEPDKTEKAADWIVSSLAHKLETDQVLLAHR